MTILNYQEELKNYNERLKYYNEIAGEIKQAETESGPLLQKIPNIPEAINDDPSIDTNNPETLTAHYEKLITITDQLDASVLTSNCSPCGFYNRQKFNYRRDKLLEAAERLKTAILQGLLKKMIEKLEITNDIELLKQENHQTFWKKTVTYFLWLSALLYGCFKGYSAVAGVLAAFTGPQSIALIISSSASAGLFCLMLMAFEGREICNARGLNGNDRSTRAQFSQQYQLAAEMSNKILKYQIKDVVATQPKNPARQQTLEKYHTIITRIHKKDLSKKIDIATDYKNKASKSTARKVVETGAGITLSILNGASFGFVGVSTMAVILKCTLASLLIAGLSTATGGIALGIFGVLFIAGVAAAWYAKKLGTNLVKTLDKKETLLDIAKTEEKENGNNSIKSKLSCSSAFFKNQQKDEPIRQQDTALQNLQHVA